jgi:hypothetical protein
MTGDCEDHAILAAYAIHVLFPTETPDFVTADILPPDGSARVTHMYLYFPDTNSFADPTCYPSYTVVSYTTWPYDLIMGLLPR